MRICRPGIGGLELVDAQARPRLETVLDTAVGTYGLDLLTDALSDLAAASPNAHHAFFAEHLTFGGRHITANFDACIERRHLRTSAVARGQPVHFHGELDLDTSREDLEALGGRLSVIENGLPAAMQDQLDAILAGEDVQALVFVGYSGSDYFDAGPYLLQRGLRHLAGKLSACLRGRQRPLGTGRGGRRPASCSRRGTLERT